MSEDARQWKKDRRGASGVNVVEYESDYSVAVEQGRRQAETDAQATAGADRLALRVRRDGVRRMSQQRSAVSPTAVIRGGQPDDGKLFYGFDV